MLHFKSKYLSSAFVSLKTCEFGVAAPHQLPRGCVCVQCVDFFVVIWAAPKWALRLSQVIGLTGPWVFVGQGISIPEIPKHPPGVTHPQHSEAELEQEREGAVGGKSLRSKTR